MNFCSTCDRKLHSKQMFHQRIGFFEREKTFFKPNEFFAEDKIEEIIKGIKNPLLTRHRIID